MIINKLNLSLANNRSVTARWPQLATVTADGKPSVRNIAFRGFLKEYLPSIDERIGNCLMFITDCRSKKVKDIRGNSSVEICWFFPDTSEQFRIQGHASLILPHSSVNIPQSLRSVNSDELDGLRRAVWSRLSSAARAQFTWPLAEHNKQGFPEDACLSLNSDDPRSKDALENFSLIMVEPLGIELLDLNVKPFGIIQEFFR